MRYLTTLFVLLLLGSCGGPLWYFPGGALQGPEHPWREAAVPPEGGVIQLETNPADPYSVNVNAAAIDGELYVDPAPDRRWYRHMADDPRVRVRFEGQKTVYAARVVEDAPAEVRARFEADRIVLRFAPRE